MADRSPDGWLDRLDDAGQDSERPSRDPRRLVAWAAGAVLAAGALIAGAAGLLLAAITLATVAGLVLALRTPEGVRPRRRGKPAPPVEHAAYRAFREVSERLSWAAVSPRHYDLTTRPLLADIAAARLAERHGVDLRDDPERAAAILGPEVWPWLDPHRPPSSNGQPPGVPRHVLTLVIDRLERL